MTYTIKQMSELTGLTPSTLRYYDSQGLLPSLKRDSNNVRIFTEDDYKNLKLINCLKKSGLSIKDIKDFIDMVDEGDGAIEKRLEIFEKRRKILRQELKNLQEVLNVIEYKCWYYSKASKEGTEAGLKNLKPSDIPEKFQKARASLLNLPFNQI